MTYPFRHRVPACSHPRTYKYYLDPNQTDETWQRLEEAHGARVRDETFKTFSIESDRLVLKSTWAATPILVIRKRRCTAEDVARLHELLGFVGNGEAE